MAKGMTKRIIDSDLSLIPYYPAYDITLRWYQDPELCRQVDNREHVYTPEELTCMYEFLSSHGDCFYINYQDNLVGDVTLRDNHEVCIVICREYQNRHLGRKCIREILRLAEEKGLPSVKANIYNFNQQSRKMFLSVGFHQISDEWFEYSINNKRLK